MHTHTCTCIHAGVAVTNDGMGMEGRDGVGWDVGGWGGVGEGVEMHASARIF